MAARERTGGQGPGSTGAARTLGALQGVGQGGTGPPRASKLGPPRRRSARPRTRSGRTFPPGLTGLPRSEDRDESGIESCLADPRTGLRGVPCTVRMTS